MKKLIFFALVIATYSTFWWTQSNRLKTEVVNFAKENGITYDAMSRKGFPFNFKLEIKNPKMQSEHLDGVVTFETDLFAKKGKLFAEGEWVGSTNIKGNLAILKPNFLQAIKGSQLDLLNDITISTDGLSFDDKAEFGKSKIWLQTKKLDENLLHTTIDCEYTTSLEKSIFANMTKNDTSITHLKMSASHPNFFEKEEFVPFSIKIEDLSGKGPFFLAKISGDISLEELNSKMHGKMNVTSSHTFTDSFPTIDQEKFQLFLEPLSAQFPITTLLDSSKLALFIPDFTSVGEITQAADLEFTANPKNFQEPIDLTIRKINLHNDRFGFDISGKLSGADIDLAIQLDHHRTLLSDLCNYYNRIRPIFAKIQPTPALNERISEHLAVFLEALSEPKEKDSVQLVVKADQSGNLQVGSKSLEELQLAALSLAAAIGAELQ